MQAGVLVGGRAGGRKLRTQTTQQGSAPCSLLEVLWATAVGRRERWEGEQGKKAATRVGGACVPTQRQ